MLQSMKNKVQELRHQIFSSTLINSADTKTDFLQTFHDINSIKNQTFGKGRVFSEGAENFFQFVIMPFMQT